LISKTAATIIFATRFPNILQLGPLGTAAYLAWPYSLPHQH
jgi:hypothetical protein